MLPQLVRSVMIIDGTSFSVPRYQFEIDVSLQPTIGSISRHTNRTYIIIQFHPDTKLLLRIIVAFSQSHLAVWKLRPITNGRRLLAFFASCGHPSRSFPASRVTILLVCATWRHPCKSKYCYNVRRWPRQGDAKKCDERNPRTFFWCSRHCVKNKDVNESAYGSLQSSTRTYPTVRISGCDPSPRLRK